MKLLKGINKRYLLPAGIIILALLCYELSFKKTIEAWNIHWQLTQQLLQSTDVSSAPGYLERKNDNLNQVIKAYRMDSTIFRNNVVTQIAALAEQQKVKFTIVPADDALYHTPNFILQKLDFEGDFFSLLKLCNRLQATSGIGLLRSVAWKAEKNTQNNTDYKKLVMEVYLEIAR